MRHRGFQKHLPGCHDRFMTTLLEPSNSGPGRAADRSATAARIAASQRRHPVGREPGTPPRQAQRRQAQRRRTSERRVWRDPGTWALAISAITIGLWVVTGGAASLVGGGVDSMLGISRLSGLVAALAALFGVVLTARPRWLERGTGLDRMISWHRLTGMTAAFAMLIHVASSLTAAGGGLGGAWSGLVGLVTSTDWFVAALVAAVLFAIVSITSWRRIRRSMSYETWHMVHLAGYLAVALAFPHALFSGSTLNGSVAAAWWWIALYLATTAIVLGSRVGGILASVLRPQTTITRVIPEAPGVASLVIRGPGVDRLGAKPGQFVGLRVLTRDLWWQAHPYSLSAATAPRALRLTVKYQGDATRATQAVRTGTPVLLEGPYGAMTMDRSRGRRVLLIGVGVGLAPMRALLEATTPAQAPLVLARAHSEQDLPLTRELDTLARQRGGALTAVTGPRTAFPGGNPFTAERLRAAVDDLATRTAFVCGPTQLQARVCHELARAGVPREHIHSERFGW